MLQIFFVFIGINIFIANIYCPLIYCYVSNLNQPVAASFKMLSKHLLFFFLVVLLSVSDIPYVILKVVLIYFVVYAILIDLELKKKVIQQFSNYKSYVNLYNFFSVLGIGAITFRLWELYVEDVKENFFSNFIFMEILVVNIIFSLSILFLLKKEARTMDFEKKI